MSNFELISSYNNVAGAENLIPKRATIDSAGYDFVAAADTIVPSYQRLMKELSDYLAPKILYSLDEIKGVVKNTKLQPTLIPTGIKCQLDEGHYLELSVRSSTPLNNWIILANGVGIIDRDYYNNPNNEGHIYFQVINLSPVDIIIKAGEKIGQGIIKTYDKVNMDTTTEIRTGGFGSTNG